MKWVQIRLVYAKNEKDEGIAAVPLRGACGR